MKCIHVVFVLIGTVLSLSDGAPQGSPEGEVTVLDSYSTKFDDGGYNFEWVYYDIHI